MKKLNDIESKAAGRAATAPSNEILEPPKRFEYLEIYQEENLNRSSGPARQDFVHVEAACNFFNIRSQI